MIHRLTMVCCLSCSVFGCAGIGTSRWAMDDEVYSDKYSKSYSGNDLDKATRIIKQASDARHVADRSGISFGASWAEDPLSAGAEIGWFEYVNASVEQRAALKGLVGTGAEDWFAGLDLGLRTQLPSRLAPFAGVGTYLGANSRSELATGDGRDNDGDGSIDEFGERDNEYSFLGSVYPELGIHFWLNGSTRLTASAQYHLTTEGRDADFWFIGFTLARLNAGFVDDE